MNEFPVYSFDVEFKEHTRDDKLLQIQLENITDYDRAFYGITLFIMIWEKVSFYGGYNENIEKMHIQYYHEPKRKRIESVMFLRKEQLVSLKNLFHLFER